MTKPRNNLVHAVYRFRSCSTCGVSDLGNLMHEDSCTTEEARIERGEILDAGEVLDRLVAEWRATHDDTKEKS